MQGDGVRELLAAARELGCDYLENEPMRLHTTFKIGGPADVFARPETEEQLCRTIALCKECGVKYYLLGNGSNILFEDAGYRGAGAVCPGKRRATFDHRQRL